MNLLTRVQILEEAVWISACANALEKGMNQSLFPRDILMYNLSID